MTEHDLVPGTPPPPEWLPGWLDWFYGIGRFVVDRVLRAMREALSQDAILQVFVFLLILFLFFVAGRLVRAVARASFLTYPRFDPAVSRLAGHFIVFVFVFFGFSIGLTIFGTNIAALATGLGLLSLALGFGMQNSVANLVGGISLAFDKPFRIGDRVQVGEYWGTVQHIGLRSTRIETPRKETVIIPNKIMEEREIWNYTRGSPEYRLDIDVPISYDSDWRLAERIMLEVADAHPNILHFPPGRVVMRKFADSSVNMQIRSWVADVTVRADTISDILKSVKDRFDAEGVEVPYPYRTLVYKTDLAKPVRPPQESIKPFKRTVEGYHLLVAVAGPQPAKERTEFVASLAKALGAGVVALYIQRPGGSRMEGQDALRMMAQVMRDQRIWFKPVVRSGDIVGTIRDVAREEDVDLILVGAGRGGVSHLWRRKPEIGSRLRQELTRPVFTVPRDLKLTPQLVSWLQEQMRTFREARRGAPEAAPAEEALPGDAADDEAAPDASPPAEDSGPPGPDVP